MLNLDAGLHIEHFTNDVLRRARAGGRKRQVAGFCLGNDVLDAGQPRLGIDGNHESRIGNRGDCREIGVGLVRQFRVQRRRNHQRATGGDQKRITVGLGFSHIVGANIAARAALVFNDDRLAQHALQLRGEQARQQIGRAAGRIRRHQRNGLGRPGGLGRGKQWQNRQDNQCRKGVKEMSLHDGNLVSLKE